VSATSARNFSIDDRMLRRMAYLHSLPYVLR
jgi:hypothetical protein